jgi:hypothetical protein
MNDYIFQMADGCYYVISGKEDIYEAIKELYMDYICDWHLSSDDFNIIVDSKQRDVKQLCELIHKAAEGSENKVEKIYRGQCICDLE